MEFINSSRLGIWWKRYSVKATIEEKVELICILDILTNKKECPRDYVPAIEGDWKRNGRNY